MQNVALFTRMYVCVHSRLIRWSFDFDWFTRMYVCVRASRIDLHWFTRMYVCVRASRINLDWFPKALTPLPVSLADWQCPVSLSTICRTPVFNTFAALAKFQKPFSSGVHLYLNHFSAWYSVDQTPVLLNWTKKNHLILKNASVYCWVHNSRTEDALLIQSCSVHTWIPVAVRLFQILVMACM
jgi:hypothetical protein